MKNSALARLHGLWDTHELHMEVAIGLLTTILLGLLLYPSFTHSTPPVSEEMYTQESPSPTETPLVTTPVPPQAASITVPDQTDRRAKIAQDLTKIEREISVIQQSSIAITSLIQKECGGQTNDCAQRLQASLKDNAAAYDRAQRERAALTAALGSLR